MAWTLLPTDYTDAVWSGLKKYNQIENSDGTVSFQDVTVYSNKEKSFFGALQANRMNGALNTIMSMVESGTNLYEEFQTYFATQKALFEAQGNSVIENVRTRTNTEYDSFVTYTNNKKAQEDASLSAIESGYETRMSQYETTQKALFDYWFDNVKGTLSGDVAGQIQEELEGLNKKVEGFVPKTTEFSPDGKHITETSDDVKREVTFNADGSITEKYYENDILIHTKNTTFSADGTRINEEVS